ncbi:helix-hairpin-helix domain-containing protein [Natrinema pallidum]|uniref:Helix-hairpin-helix domain-containing protein n=1 Tax=Natrinema pallidum DSM 3751 TaxID=1227495 RepID=L9YMQ1_9EURY|nr:helix-hairpin-helix domain-containing protein [Natrinema pallidum]ELY74767.1 hypothetical protein C487_13974 [Natrinema pallidum DSM 3751]
MAILQKLKSLLGFDESDSERGGAREVGVTVEREGSTDDGRDTDRTEPATGGITPEPSRTAASDSSAASATESEEDIEPAEPSPIEEAEPDADAESEPVETDAEPDTEPERETESEPDSESESGADATDDAETAEMASETADDADAAAEETASDPSVDDTAATTEPDETTQEPVDEIKGIGPAYADRLAGAGVDTVGELADADAAELADRTDISEKRIQGWIDRAEVR